MSGDKSTKGQVTIFVIIALVIIVLGILIYSFFPEIKSTLELEEKSPTVFIQDCVEEKLGEVVETISLQGGSYGPTNYYTYDGEKVSYLCYTNEYYKLCSVQRPFLRNHIESEIKEELQGEVSRCFNSLKADYQNKGYDVDIKLGEELKVELLPKRVLLTPDYEVTLTKGDVEKYTAFNIVLNNNLYELVAIATSITGVEAVEGEAETRVYMALYPDLKVEKLKQTDGSTIYILTDKNIGTKFQFASRSLANPPGFVL